MFCIFSFCFYSAYSQKKLSGIYHDQDGRTVEIFNDKFLWVEDPYDLATWFGRIRAEATYSWVDDEFIELHSRPPMNSMRIIQSRNVSYDNSISVVVTMPEIRNRKLNVKLSYLRNNEWDTITSVYSRREPSTFIIPNDVRKINLFLEPQQQDAGIIDFESGTGLYSSVLYYKTHDIELIDSVNKIQIEILDVGDPYFGKYYPDGEYVQVSGNTILWRGRIFTKTNLHKQIQYIKEIEKPKWWKKDEKVSDVRRKVRKYLDIE